MLVIVLRRFGRVYHSGQAVKDCLTLQDGNYQHTLHNNTEDKTLDGQLSCGGKKGVKKNRKQLSKGQALCVKKCAGMLLQPVLQS